MAFKPIARVGDTHECPIPGHGTTTIVSGDSLFTVDGRPAATVGSKTGCGATIVQGSPSGSVNDKAISYLGCTSDHGGVITSGSPEHKIEAAVGSFVGSTSSKPYSDENGLETAYGGYTSSQASNTLVTRAGSDQTQQWEPVINTKTLPDQSLRHMLEQNREEILLLTPEEAFRVHEWAKNHWSENYDKEAYQFTFDTLKDYSVHTKDAYHIAVLIRAFNGVGLKSYSKVVDGKTYIIFKGYAGIRQILTGTRYLASNTKIIQIGLGKKGMGSAIKSGGVLSIFVISGMRGADYLLRDEATMAELLGGIGLDFAKLGVSTAVAWGMGVAAAGTVIGSFALGPLMVVVGVGLLATWGLNKLDEHYKIEEKLIEVLERTQQEAAALAEKVAEFEPEDVFWDVAAAYLDGVLEKGRRVIEEEVRNYIKRRLSHLPFYNIKIK